MPHLAGYQHAAYAQALAEFGRPLPLPRAGGWLLQRPIPTSCLEDAVGCYPLLACLDWTKLGADLDALAQQSELVSVTAVTDPLGNYEPADLQRAFRDLTRPFKEHFVVDLAQAWPHCVSAHHRRNARQALAQLQVEVCAPETALDEWSELYAQLIQRHEITGIAAFSRQSFAQQLQVPGLHLLRAQHASETVGMIWWLRSGERAYYHLAAYSARGYELKASFALFWESAGFFAAAGVRWLVLGAGAGLKADTADGLTRFKRGWASDTRIAYLCGRIFNHAAYAALTHAAGVTATDYFPAYRAPVGVARSTK